jgi:predicted MPP superfamily phosphohydrolase
MFFHILSDIHLEFLKSVNTIDDLIKVYPNLYYNCNRIENKEKYLILAGDIGYPTSENYHNFLKSCGDEYKEVFCVLGNHEYYNSEIKYIQDYVKTTFKNLENIHFLIDEELFLGSEEDVVILGTTLWTNIDRYSSSLVKGSMNDYNYINVGTSRLTIEDTNNLHNMNFKFLKEKVEKYKNNKIIIITHHLPTKKLIHEKYYAYGSLNKAFYTDLEDFIITNTDSVKLWVCGHSHSSKEEKINNTQLILNPIGYIHEREKNLFIIEIKEFELK